MLRRVDNAYLQHYPSIFGKGPFVLVLGRRQIPVGGNRKWSERKVQEFLHYSAQQPAFVASYGGRWYWLYADRIFWDNDHLRQEQIHALLITRDQRQQRKVDRAVAMVQQGQQDVPNSRGRISDEVKLFVWQRDNGRCRNCDATTELQFDHVIPVSLGGSNDAENLQLLCGPCNRMKGSGLTVRDLPPRP